MTEIDTTTIALESGRTVSAIFQAPPRPTALLVLAHGAGAGMTHPFMSAVAERLSARTVATLRYQFPFMEAGFKATRPARDGQGDRARRSCGGARHGT